MNSQPENDPPVRCSAWLGGHPRRSEIESYVRWCSKQLGKEVSPLAILLALSAHERGDHSALHDWVSDNAIAFDAVMRACPPNDEPSERARKT